MYSSLALVVFLVTYFVAWVTKELPQSTWVTVSAIAAVVTAVVLLIENVPWRGTRQPASST